MRKITVKIFFYCNFSGFLDENNLGKPLIHKKI
jgi:hypothetical protein